MKGTETGLSDSLPLLYGIDFYRSFDIEFKYYDMLHYVCAKYIQEWVETHSTEVKA